MALEGDVSEIKVFIPSLSTALLPRTPEAIAQEAFKQYNQAYAQTDGRHHQAVILVGDKIGLVEHHGAGGTKYTPLHKGKGLIPASVREHARRTGLVILKDVEAFERFKERYDAFEGEANERFQLYERVPNPERARAAA